MTLTEEDGDKTIYTKRCEYLDRELEERKRWSFALNVTCRLRTEVENITQEKAQHMNELTRLKLHVQNTVAEQLTKAEEVGMERIAYG